MSDFIRGSEWRKWDLHIHSNASDGKSTPEEIIEAAKSKNLSVIALTDHHTVANVAATKALGASAGISVITGVEFKTEYGAKSVHLIGLFPDAFGGIELSEEAINNFVFAKLGISRTAIIAKGRAQNPNCGDEEAFKNGMLNVFVDFKSACKTIHELGGIVVVHNGGKKNGLDAEVKHLGGGKHNAHSLYEDLGVLKEELLRDHIDVCEVRSADDDADFYLSKFGKPSIAASDAHDTSEIGEKFTWIKADPTFEGLRQIVVEPAERVRIQANTPAVDFEKSPFTAIKFSSEVYPFEGDTNVQFKPMELPLNDGLVSIVGGRGAGKSTLIDFVSNGLMPIRNEKFTYEAEGMSVSRKTAIDEPPQNIPLPILDNQSVPFVYISQSQIKNLVADKNRFTQNLRETIGVKDDYVVPADLRGIIDSKINEFYGLVKTINPNKNEDEKSEKIRLEQEIGKCKDFIARITSEKNKAKLERYSNLVSRRKNLGILVDQIEKFKATLFEVVAKKNEEIASLNHTLRLLDINIPLLDATATQKYIDETVLPMLRDRSSSQQNEIDAIKSEFHDYTGDIGTLLGQVADYREKQEALIAQLDLLKAAEEKYCKFKQEGFAAIGRLIRQSVEEYKAVLGNKWNTFKHGASGMSDERRVLLNKILNERSLDFKVEIVFDMERMCEMLLEGLDHRRFNAEKIMGYLASVSDLEGFWAFIEQRDGDAGLFSEGIPLQLRGRIIDVFYRRFHEFIRHDAMILSGGKPITKLSHGQQGTIYLRLQIAANLFSETLIYDQPEDDLDNQFITSELVGIFREIKKYRQVIIVSHNANLVVNADSEQVIVAENNEGVLTYRSGSLENPNIREDVCNILEGGREAFARRGLKYRG